MSLKHSYTLLAPLYDPLVEAATRQARRDSLAALPAHPSRVLLAGIGTGLDLPLLPAGHRYVGLDLTRAMLRRALPRAVGIDFIPVQGDAQRLPFPDACFDAAVLHLILAVVPNPAASLAEAARVVRPGGRLLVLDKFLRPGQPAILRRLLHPVASRVATGLNVVFEDVLAQVDGVQVESDQAALAGGWFRRIVVRREC